MRKQLTDEQQEKELLRLGVNNLRPEVREKLVQSAAARAAREMKAETRPDPVQKAVKKLKKATSSGMVVTKGLGRR